MVVKSENILFLNIFITSNHLNDELGRNRAFYFIPCACTVIVRRIYRARDGLVWSVHVCATKYGTHAPNIRLTCANLAVAVASRASPCNSKPCLQRGFSLRSTNVSLKPGSQPPVRAPTGSLRANLPHSVAFRTVMVKARTSPEI